MRLLTLALLLAACTEDPSEGPDPDAAAVLDAAALDAAALDAAVLDAAVLDAAAPDAAPPLGGADRPALIFTPAGDPPAEGWPLLFVLHGFRANPEFMRRQFPFDRRINAHQWVVVYPQGGTDADGFLYWQAHERVDAVGDDVPYLLTLADQVAARSPIDLQHFFVIGHSNGGAMAQSMACYAADRIRGFANISGHTIDPARCTPARPITGLYIGGDTDPAYTDPPPGIEASATWWAETILGCFTALEDAPSDFTLAAAGAETHILRWRGCANDTTAQRWRMEGVGHGILANDAFLDAVHTALTSP